MTEVSLNRSVVKFSVGFYEHGLVARYSQVHKKVYLQCTSSGICVELPYKKLANRDELREYAEDYIDMLINMGGG